MRLGHVNERGLVELGKQNLLGGDKVEKLKFCEPCVFEKYCRVKFNKGKQRTHGSLDYIHADIWGPARSPSHSGARYFLSVDVVDWLKFLVKLIVVLSCQNQCHDMLSVVVKFFLMQAF